MTTGAAPSRTPIRKLPALLVNQIAAGEVVERPASVVKELVENALDAGARAITVEIEQGGIELVRITDDGGGIPEAELALAIAPHATSKIASPEDLDRIGTMGFRGEAIASIASVSRLSIRSRSPSQSGASVIEVEGDDVKPVRPAAGPIGTCVSVRNLFFNTPARRKFLRTISTEQGHCVDAACTLAISHPAVAFRVVTDSKVVLDVPPGQGPRDRALAVLGVELAEQMLEVTADRFDDTRGLTLWGLIGLPAIARATPKAQHVFLNGRPIRDKTVQHAIREAYRGLIEPGRYPTCVLMIEMDPGAVDVNVHPAKTEVRFRDQSMVHQAVLRAVREALRGADLTPRVGNAVRAGDMFGAGNIGGQPLGDGVHAPAGGAASFVDFFRREIPDRVQNRFDYQSVRDALDRVAPGMIEDAGAGEPAQPDSPVHPLASSPVQPQTEPATSLPLPEPKDRLLQVHNSYVVTQDEQGLLIVDQHALHERIMFEVLLARIVGEGSQAGRPLESQSLLAPVPVRVQRSAATRLEELRPILAKIGIEAELLSPESVGVRAFPSFLFERGVDPAEFISELFERADAEGFAPASEQALHEVLDMMACKAAVKAGDRMSDIELGDLLRLRDLVERSSNCPHGRPTSIRLTIGELERRFGRA
ncbi:MAG TPA: DNA mismatch repair endonuclease MutL [Phycisphaerales bacterium]|nr:DNA mismatch repair endonuclease MutL [Phycisphaerales bacterium]